MKQKWNSDFVDPQLLQSEESFLVLRNDFSSSKVDMRTTIYYDK